MPKPITLAGAAFLLYAGVSLMWSPNPTLGAAWLGSLVLAFFLGTKLPSQRWIWHSFIWLVAMFACAQPWLPIAVNQNAVGCAVVIALTAAVIYEVWIFFPIGIIALWFTQSRGALFAFGAILASRLWPKYPATAWCTFLLAIVAGAIVWKAKVEVNVVDNIAQRLGIWQDTINHTTFFGDGLGAFGSAYASWPVHRNMTGTLTTHAYNDYLELIFDLGIGTLPLWLFIVMCLELQVPLRLICFAFLLLSLTFFPLYIPLLGQLFALVLGKLYHERKLHGPVETYPAALSQSPWNKMGIHRELPHERATGSEAV